MDLPDSTGQERAQETAEVRELRTYLRSVGDTLRLLILRHLAHVGEMNVTDLARALRASQPLLSWHLGVLKRSQLVSVRRDGREAWYSVNMPMLRGYRERLDAWLGMAGGVSKESIDE
jgi:DNA-binding transcriptional ArsR family regulator